MAFKKKTTTTATTATASVEPEVTEAEESQVEAQDVAQEKPVEVKKEKAQAPEVEETIVYSTVRPCNVLFNILCKGEVIYGHFSDKRKAIHFAVPKRLVKAFELHHHVRSGYIVPLSSLPEALR